MTDSNKTFIDANGRVGKIGDRVYYYAIDHPDTVEEAKALPETRVARAETVSDVYAAGCIALGDGFRSEKARNMVILTDPHEGVEEIVREVKWRRAQERKEKAEKELAKWAMRQEVAMEAVRQTAAMEIMNGAVGVILRAMDEMERAGIAHIGIADLQKPVRCERCPDNDPTCYCYDDKPKKLPTYMPAAMGPGRPPEECPGDELLDEFEAACRAGDTEFSALYRAEIYRRMQGRHVGEERTLSENKE